MKFRIIAIVWALVGCVLVPVSAQASDPPTWTTPVQLGEELPSSWFPDIYADAAGAARIVFSASLIEGDTNEIDGLNGAVLISELGSGGWSQPADIAVMDGGIASRPMIVSDGQYAHLIYRTAPVGEPVRVVYTRAALTSDLGNARSWSEPLVLSSDEAYWAQIAALPDGGLLVVYNRITAVKINGASERRTGIFSRQSLDQGATWGVETRIADIDARAARTSLAVTPGSAHVIVAWDEGYDNLTAQGQPSGIGTAVSEDGGLHWDAAVRISEGVEQSTVVTDGATTMLLYRATLDDALLYRTSADGGRSWSLEKQVPDALARPYGGPHNFDKLSAAFDGDGRLLFTWVGPNEDAPNGLAVMLATFDDGQWTTPAVLASPMGFPEYPRIAVSLGNQIELVYFVRDKEFDVGAYTMWTLSGTSDARATAAETFTPIRVEPTVVPTPAPIAINSQPEAPAATTPVGAVVEFDSSPQATLTSPIVPVLAITVAALIAIMLMWWLFKIVRDARI